MEGTRQESESYSRFITAVVGDEIIKLKSQKRGR